MKYKSVVILILVIIISTVITTVKIEKNNIKGSVKKQPL